MIYLDANVIIRLVTADAVIRGPLDARLAPTYGKVGMWATSRLSRLECRVRSVRYADVTTIALYEKFFSADELTVFEVDAAVIDAATELRARYGFKSPDAIHLATAMVHGAATFLTGDKALVRCPVVPVEVL